MFNQINRALTTIRKKQPLILNITNQVTMDFIANGLLSLGASPLMTQAIEEAEDLVKIADAIVINIGTIDDKFIALCERVCELANQFQKPLILDPVGAGASLYRTTNCKKLISQFEMTVIRANASEILALSGGAESTKGVDSRHQGKDALRAAQSLCHQNQAVIVISGKDDIVVNSQNVKELSYGSDWMPKVTGTGCLLSAVIAAFVATTPDYFDACVNATTFYGISGEKAARETKGPASFKSHFIDALHRETI